MNAAGSDAPDRSDSPDESDLPDGSNALATSVPEGQVAVRCPHCRRPFPEERLRTLHVGLDHPDALDADERGAFERAYLDEFTEIRRYRLQILGMLIVLYFLLVIVYAMVT